MRFRRLTMGELKELHQEFIQYLSSNTITGEDWKKIKEEEYEKAEKLIDMFSDIVFEKSISNIKYLEKRESKSLLLFHCKEKELELIGISLDENSKFDLTRQEDLNELSQDASSVEISSFKSSKAYAINREDELFKMLNEGCLATDEKLFNSLVTTL